MPENKKGSKSFKPKARLLILLGEQLIRNEIISVVELIKNSYDADATKVDILFDKVTGKGGEIKIIDNGSGMSKDTVLNVWFEPGTEHRLKQRDDGERTPKFKRIPLGEKGIGRFAAHKLGDVVELVTRAEKNEKETVVTVDWNKFSKNDYLENIKLGWKTRKPELFDGCKHDGLKYEKHGTQITIRNIRKEWKEPMAENLFKKIHALNSPFSELSDFKVNITSAEFSKLLEKIPDMGKVLEKAIYSITGSINDDGIFKYKYKFSNSAFPDLERSVTYDESVKIPPGFFHKRNPCCGPFEVKFFVWDLDHKTLGETITQAEYKAYVKPHTGIKIFRDGFRVWPYGEEDDDSFELDARRVNNPTQCLSRNQVIGIVDISSIDNKELRDKTNREGLIENKEYSDFRVLLRASLNILEIERRKDKDRVDALREKKRPEDSMEIAIDDLKVKMKKQGDWEAYEKNVNRVEKVYHDKLRDVIEPLYRVAGIGIAYTLPIHEISRNVSDTDKALHNILNELEKMGAGKKLIDELNNVIHTISIMDDLTKGVGKIMRKGRKETFSLSSVAEDCFDILKPRLEKNYIKPKISGDKRIKVKGRKNMISTCILNLMDNSIYWLQHIPDDRKIIIHIKHNDKGEPMIVVSDNGLGIKDDPQDLIKPFWTRKPDGSGLGLYIVDRMMKAHNGKIIFLKKGKDKELLDGANVALCFPKGEN